MINAILDFVRFAGPALVVYAAANLVHSFYVGLVAYDTRPHALQFPGMLYAVRDVGTHFVIAVAVGLCTWHWRGLVLITLFGVLIDLDHIPLMVLPSRCRYGRLSHSTVFLVLSTALIWMVSGDIRLPVAAVAGFLAHIGYDHSVCIGLTPRSAKRLGPAWQAAAYVGAVLLAVWLGSMGFK
jgi:hypothetical protein